MQVVILAGGKGTRLSESKQTIPKPLVCVGGIPIIVHIINYYCNYGYNDFIICLGFKGELIKKFFSKKKILGLEKNLSIKLINTGKNSLTGDRIKKIEKYIKKPFFLTYGDGLSNINLKLTLKIFLKRKKIGLITAINPKSRFGTLNIKKNNLVKNIYEKNFFKNTWVNGGFFIFSKKIFKYLKGKNIILEEKPLKKMAKDNQLICYKHRGFWGCMDTYKDKLNLEEIWNSKKVPWIKK
jgi:glucose-1-phosphate cytidylyltransferase